jgi:cytochrome b
VVAGLYILDRFPLTVRTSCHTWRYLLRCLIQMVLLTPKTGLLPDPPANRPALGAILGANLLCVILHIFSSAPSAGEATRGYLHGGFVMDFIGQKGPSSKLHLLALDLVVILLQVVHLSAFIARQRLKKEGISERLMALFSADPKAETWPLA